MENGSFGLKKGTGGVNGQSSSCDETINKIHEQGDNIERIVFGHDSTTTKTYKPIVL